MGGNYQESQTTVFACGSSFSANYAIICSNDSLTFIHHNELKDLTASWLHKVLGSGCMLSLPYSHALTGKALDPTSANHRDNARVNIHATGFGVANHRDNARVNIMPQVLG